MLPANCALGIGIRDRAHCSGCRVETEGRSGLSRESGDKFRGSLGDSVGIHFVIHRHSLLSTVRASRIRLLTC